ncbi:MAG: serine hydrolase domain-containing protein [Caldilineaceae bacterium]
MSRINAKLQQLIPKEANKSLTHSVLLGVQSGDDRVQFRGAAGDASPESPYFIASITKMFTTTVVMQLVDEGRLNLDAPIQKYLPHLDLERIHVHKGVDYSQDLKLYQLIHQTSGLADYFEDALVDDLKQNKDRAYDLDDVLGMVRQMSPTAMPGSGKSYYSDTNYQLLGAIIEAVTEAPLAEVFHSRIFEPLQLEETEVYDYTRWQNKTQPLPFYHKAQRLNLPLALSSMGADGAIVSTLLDTLCFLRAYFAGGLFDSGHFERMMKWNALFFPFEYGYGLMRVQLPRWMTLFRPTPELVGHSGASGSFAFYAPQKDLYIAGTFNQMDKRSRPLNFMLNVINVVEKLN